MSRQWARYSVLATIYRNRKSAKKCKTVFSKTVKKHDILFSKKLILRKLGAPASKATFSIIFGTVLEIRPSYGRYVLKNALLFGFFSDLPDSRAFALAFFKFFYTGLLPFIRDYFRQKPAFFRSAHVGTPSLPINFKNVFKTSKACHF